MVITEEIFRKCAEQAINDYKDRCRIIDYEINKKRVTTFYKSKSGKSTYQAHVDFDDDYTNATYMDPYGGEGPFIIAFTIKELLDEYK